jgi:phosphohistidine phosphatase
MSRELLIVRHGKSDWSVEASDFDRPLKKRGKKAATHLGKWLHEQHIRPDVIITSPANRAIATARLVSEAMRVDHIVEDVRIYEASLNDLLSVLTDAPEEKNQIMLIGHNPGLESLLLYLVNKNISVPADGKLLPTASLAHLTMPEDWQKLPSGCAQLIDITRARDLPELGH